MTLQDFELIDRVHEFVADIENSDDGAYAFQLHFNAPVDTLRRVVDRSGAVDDNAHLRFYVVSQVKPVTEEYTGVHAGWEYHSILIAFKKEFEL